MVRPMIHDVQHGLPERLSPGAAFQIGVGNGCVGLFISELSRPQLPPLEQRRPVALQNGKMPVGIGHKLWNRSFLQTRQPDAIGSKDVDERTENTVVGSVEIAGAFFLG